MSRWSGLLIVLLLVGLIGALRVYEAGVADSLIASESAAARRIAGLHARSLEAVQRGQKHPGLRGEFLAADTAMRELPELSSEEISYATDDVYVYGLATRPWRDEKSGVMNQGYILRAWPVDYGVTGDQEFQIRDDGQLWQGQNRTGRSGTRHGFPPPFPDPDIGQPGAAWWPRDLPDHR